MDWKTISNNVLLVGLFVGMVTMFNQVNNRLDIMQVEYNRRFDIIQTEYNRRFDTMQAEYNRRFDTMQAEMGQMRTEMSQMRTEINHRFDTMQTENQRQHDEIKDVLRVFEGRITRLEEKAGIGPETAE